MLANEHADLARRIAEVDRLIHEPARLMIVMILYSVKEADFLYLLRETGLTKGNLSAHLAKLEEAGYIHIEKTYRIKIPLTLCSLTEPGRKAYVIYRDQLKRLIENE
jgi:DNA-binding MarR family transcriptional regulator